MIHGLLFGLGLCLAPFVVLGVLASWRWLAVGVIAVLALVVLVIVHATGLADWRLVGLAFVMGTCASFMLLAAIGFDPLRTALFMNAGLIAAAVFLVQHTLPPQPDPFRTTIASPQG